MNSRDAGSRDRFEYARNAPPTLETTKSPETEVQSDTESDAIARRERYDKERRQEYKDRMLSRGKDEDGLPFPSPNEYAKMREEERMLEKNRKRDKAREERARREIEAKHGIRLPPYQSRADWQISAADPTNAALRPHLPSPIALQYGEEPSSTEEAQYHHEFGHNLDHEALSQTPHSSLGHQRQHFFRILRRLYHIIPSLARFAGPWLPEMKIYMAGNDTTVGLREEDAVGLGSGG